MHLDLIAVVPMLDDAGKVALWSAIMDAASAEHTHEVTGLTRDEAEYHQTRKHDLWDAADYVRHCTPSLMAPA